MQSSRQPDAQGLDLYERARAAANAAYVPYSNFRVGAALRTTSGEIVTGCNVENASFGLTICAERVACTAAVARGQREFAAIAIHVEGPDGQPCGACRQVLAEFAPGMDVVYRQGDDVVMRRLDELLPNAFLPSSLPV